MAGTVGLAAAAVCALYLQIRHGICHGLRGHVLKHSSDIMLGNQQAMASADWQLVEQCVVVRAIEDLVCRHSAVIYGIENIVLVPYIVYSGH